MTVEINTTLAKKAGKILAGAAALALLSLSAYDAHYLKTAMSMNIGQLQQAAAYGQAASKAIDTVIGLQVCGKAGAKSYDFNKKPYVAVCADGLKKTIVVSSK